MGHNEMIVVGVTLDYTCASDTPDQVSQSRAYANAIVAAGAVPVFIPPLREEASLRRVFDLCDAFCFPGGPDVDPTTYGEPAHAKTAMADRVVEETEITLMRWALDEAVPLLAICRGLQLLNVVRGGTLWQDLHDQEVTQEAHQGHLDALAHDAAISESTLLRRLIGAGVVRTNSEHHQAIRHLGQGVVVNAVAPDGVIEGVELPDHPFALGVQFHPERLTDDHPWALNLFRALVTAARQAAAIPA